MILPPIARVVVRGAQVALFARLAFVSSRFLFWRLRPSTFAPVNLTLLYPEVAPTVVLLVHRRVECGSLPEICANAPARSTIWVERQSDPLTTAARAGETGPFLDRAALDQD